MPENNPLHVQGKTYAYPPEHFGQDWETFNPENWDETEMLDYTYQKEGHSVYGIQLFELMESGVFDWSRPELDWSEAAYDEEQYKRFCAYFVARFRFREIGIIPPLEWMNALHYKLVYELMPKYKPLYSAIADGINPLAGEDEYFKRRNISSAYPETMLSGNSDYASDGVDEEYERIKIYNVGDAVNGFLRKYQSTDKLMADELEVLFIGAYTSYTNAL